MLTPVRVAADAVSQPSVRRPWIKRFFAFPLIRIVLAVFFISLAGGLTMSYFSDLPGKPYHGFLPELTGSAALLAAYWLYVRVVERRRVAELMNAFALTELFLGLTLGAIMVAITVGLLYLQGVYQFAGIHALRVGLLIPLAQMTFVGVFEEVLCRGIIFRILEKSVGSAVALLVSSLLFGLGHIPGDGVGVLAIFNTVIAGAFFALAFTMTRHLWLCIGIHVAWNYALGTVFSLVVSGRSNDGLFSGKLIGATWLTGGGYGVEASLVTSIVFLAACACFSWRTVVAGNWCLSKQGDLPFPFPCQGGVTAGGFE